MFGALGVPRGSLGSVESWRSFLEATRTLLQVGVEHLQKFGPENQEKIACGMRFLFHITMDGPRTPDISCERVRGCLLSHAHTRDREDRMPSDLFRVFDQPSL